jgi:putative membrane protein
MDTQIRDQLARQRTELANERTLLAYIRTALGFVIVGVPALWWIDHLYVQGLGALSLAVGLGCLALGIHRFVEVKHMIAREFGSQEGTAQIDRSKAASVR